MGPAAAIRERHRAEDLLSNKYGHKIHFWDLRARKNVQTIDLGANHQMALEIRPRMTRPRIRVLRRGGGHHQPARRDLYLVAKDDGTFEAKKTITIDPVPADADDLPPICSRALARCRRWSPTST
jgi:selenium-binding protein 1